MKKINVVIVDDYAIVLAGIKSTLANCKDIEVVATALNGEDAIAKVDEFLPDVVLLDIDIPNVSGIEITKYITKKYPDIKVILFTSSIAEEHIVGGIAAGACGYMPKTYKSNQLLEAIRMVMNGEKYFKGEVAEIFIKKYHEQDSLPTSNVKNKLTYREIEIIKNVADGLSNHEIAVKLGINIRTVEMHKYHIRKKLEIKGTAELVKYAIRHGIIIT